MQSYGGAHARPGRDLFEVSEVLGSVGAAPASQPV